MTLALPVPPVGLRPPYATSRAKLTPTINGSPRRNGGPFCAPIGGPVWTPIDTYAERLASVREVGPDDVACLKRTDQERSDSEVIAIVREVISGGVNTKLAIRDTVAATANISRQSAIRVIERYTGTDPNEHRWNFVRKAHGAMFYSLLNTQPEGDPSANPEATG